MYHGRCQTQPQYMPWTYSVSIYIHEYDEQIFAHENNNKKIQQKKPMETIIIGLIDKYRCHYLVVLEQSTTV